MERLRAGKIARLGSGCLLALAVQLVPAASSAGENQQLGLSQGSFSMRVTFDSRQPGLSALSVDSLKQGQLPGQSPSSIPAHPRFPTRLLWAAAGSATPSAPIQSTRFGRCGAMAARSECVASTSRMARAESELDLQPRRHPCHAAGPCTPAGDIALPAVLHPAGNGVAAHRCRGSQDGGAALRCPAESYRICQSDLSGGDG